MPSTRKIMTFVPAGLAIGSALLRLLSSRGRDAALAAEVEVHRRRAAADPAAYLPHLAMSLNNLSIQLSGWRRVERLAASEEAVEVYRRLAAADPAAYLPLLAASLSNLWGRWGDMGRRPEALAAIDEAVEVYRRLAEANPAADLPDLAKSLNIRWIALAGVGRLVDADRAHREAEGIRATMRAG
jgi:tetratricopeptide (TPR) repeat protein